MLISVVYPSWFQSLAMMWVPLCQRVSVRPIISTRVNKQTYRSAVAISRTPTAKTLNRATLTDSVTSMILCWQLPLDELQFVGEKWLKKL